MFEVPSGGWRNIAAGLLPAVEMIRDRNKRRGTAKSPLHDFF